MRHLIVMRHAKAEPGEDKTDFDRELTELGWRDAECVARVLAAARLVPETVFCSAARRTRDTLSAMLAHMPGDCSIRLMGSLYLAEVVDLRDAVRTAPGQCVLLIGHNPAVHGLAKQFAGPLVGELDGSFPTATAAVFSMGFAIDTIRFERLIAP